MAACSQLHFGDVCVVNIMVGLQTPRYGLLMLAVATMTSQPPGAIVRQAALLSLAAILVLAVIAVVP